MLRTAFYPTNWGNIYQDFADNLAKLDNIQQMLVIYYGLLHHSMVIKKIYNDHFMQFCDFAVPISTFFEGFELLSNSLEPLGF